MMPIIDGWPREWRELVHEYGFIDVQRMMNQNTDVREARMLLAARRRRIEQMVG